MFENETLDNVLWSVLGLAVGAIGILAASMSVGVSHLRGANSGRFPLYCAFIAAIALWGISLMSDPICSMVLALSTSLGAFMSFVYWLNRKG